MHGSPHVERQTTSPPDDLARDAGAGPTSQDDGRGTWAKRGRPSAGVSSSSPRSVVFREIDTSNWPESSGTSGWASGVYCRAPVSKPAGARSARFGVHGPVGPFEVQV